MFLAALPLLAPAQNARPDPEMQRYERALEAIRLEQQAIFQQFQMIQALQQQEMQSAISGQPPLYVPQGQLPNYDELQRAKEQQQDRLNSYSGQLEELYERYRQLGEQSAELVQQMQGLAQRGR
jgi:hypothetical protein